LLIGRYAQRHYLADHLARELGASGKSVTETVRAFRAALPEFLPLPHPSWRSKIWMEKNPWFARQLLPVLRRRVRELLG
jgi:uracil-DNA glycosylase